MVHSHPREDSFSAALRDAAVRGLQAGGHEVRVRNLDREAFSAAMSVEEWRAYLGPEPVLDPLVASHAADVRWAELLVFVYPTWWFGLPARLKGWLDRVLVPGVAFTLDGQRVRPALRQVRRIVGVTTYGSPRWAIALANDAGRRTLTALRTATGVRCRTTWFALYGVDARGPEERSTFLRDVEQGMARL